MPPKTESIHVSQRWSSSVRAAFKFQTLGMVVACLLCVGGNRGFGQCVYQNADGHPYLRAFGPITPLYHGPPKLSNPLTNGTAANPSKPLKIVTFGDSAMWGNGDLPKQRIAWLVGQSVANETQRTVVVDAFAHSGARLKRVDPDKGWLLPLDGENALSDLDAERPTTEEQIVCASGIDSDAEIVLLDGCINEVGATDIALPIFPFLNDTSPAQIQERVYGDCGMPMKTALKHVMNDFPKATIVLLNYWLVVSQESKPVEAENTTEIDLARACQLRDPEETRTKGQKWWSNSECFLGTSQKCFTWAIACANGTIQGPQCVLPDATNDPTDPQECPPGPFPPPKSPRVFLAVVPDNPEYAYGASDTHLWRAPIHFLFWTWHKDEMYNTRAELCDLFALPSDSGCKVNVTAHPNPNGAKFYASSIMGILESAWRLNQTPAAQQR